MSNPLSTPSPSTVPGSRGGLALFVAAAVDEVGGIQRSAGDGVGVVTQYRGGTVTGVRLAEGEVTVCIVVRGVWVQAAADMVRTSVSQALKRAGETRRVNVVVADIDVDFELGWL